MNNFNNNNKLDRFLENLVGYNSQILTTIPSIETLNPSLFGRNGVDFAVGGKYRLYSKPVHVKNGIYKIDECGIYHQDKILDFSYSDIKTTPFMGAGLNLKLSSYFLNKHVDLEDFKSGQFIEIINPIIRYDLKSSKFILLNGKVENIGKFDWNLFFESIQNFTKSKKLSLK